MILNIVVNRSWAMLYRKVMLDSVSVHTWFWAWPTWLTLWCRSYGKTWSGMSFIDPDVQVHHEVNVGSEQKHQLFFLFTWPFWRISWSLEESCYVNGLVSYVVHYLIIIVSFYIAFHLWLAKDVHWKKKNTFKKSKIWINWPDRNVKRQGS